MIKNEQRITKEFCQGKILIFFPRTEAEAIFIQECLIALGFAWGTSGAQVTHVSQCLQEGMQLDNGKIHYKVHDSDLQKGFLCSADQFEQGYKTDRELMLAMFNKISTRLAAIEEALQPEKIEKPAIGSKKSPSFTSGF